MGIRAVKNTDGAVNISSKDLLALIQNPDHFDKMLTDLSTRIAEAEAAEAVAKAAKDGAESGKAEIEAAKTAAEEAIDRVRKRHDQEMASERESAMRTKDNLNARTNELGTRMTALEEKEREIIHRSSALKEQEREMAARDAESAGIARKNMDDSNRLAALSDALAVREQILLDREDKFAERLRMLNAGL